MRCARSRTSSFRLRDGTRLAARIWLPEDAETNPVPAILEYLPYRKRDGTAPRAMPLTHPYFAGHGYAAVRVDIRGTGESDGLLAGRVSEAGAGRLPGGARLAGGAALVHRRLRHDRHLLGRLQRAAGGGAPAAGAEGGHHALLHRRPLRRRHPLHGRLPAGRQSRLGLGHVRPAVLPARPGAGRRALARDVAASAWRTSRC